MTTVNNTTNNDQTRRDFLKTVLTGAAAAGVTGGIAGALTRSTPRETVWQLDPEKCIQCGKCETACVLTPSAVKCVHAYELCGYCDLCFGYFRTGPKKLNAGAENQRCPTGAIKRTFIEEPFYEYKINEPLCIGCGKCVEGCATFGNGSLFLQVRHDRCLNCNECAIARACPAHAFRRVPADTPYILKGKGASGSSDPQ